MQKYKMLNSEPEKEDKDLNDFQFKKDTQSVYGN